MTDSTDDEQTNNADGRRAGIDSRVPSDVEWNLECQVPFDGGESYELTSAIIEAVARTERVPPREIKDPPLYEVLDVVALEDALFGVSDIGHEHSGPRVVEFMYRTHRIVIRSDGWVQVYQSGET